MTTIQHQSTSELMRFFIQPPKNQVEIKNYGTEAVDVSSYCLGSLFSCAQLKDLNVISGSLNIPPGWILAVSGFSLNNSAADIGLYETNSFGSSSAMKDFVQWGSSGNGRESVAVSRGIWTAGDFVTTAPSGSSIEFDGEGRSATDWTNQPNPTIGSENATRRSNSGNSGNPYGT